MDGIGHSLESRRSFWLWVKRQRKVQLISELKTVDWEGNPCKYNLHKKGYLEILSQNKKGEYRVFTAIQLISTKKGLSYRKGPLGEGSVIFTLCESDVMLKISLKYSYGFLSIIKKILKLKIH